MRRYTSKQRPPQPQLYKLDGLMEGQIVKRPSQLVRTPYVADVLCLHNNEVVLSHSPSLGCCGLADAPAHILMAQCPESKYITKPKNKANLKCSHTIYLAIVEDRGHKQFVGIFPKLAENLTENAIKTNCLRILKNVQSYKRETPIFVADHVDSRFDFSGVDENNIPFILEVKNVPLADYEDLPEKTIKHMDFSGRDVNSKVAYFPDGYRKVNSEPVSPRALKHIQELTYIRSTTNTRCIMCYVIQRTDVNRFVPSIIDPFYQRAFKEAVAAGVEIITMVVHWNENGEAHFVRDDLPICDF